MAGDVTIRCEHCGYSLAGLSASRAGLYRCPECGRRVRGADAIPFPALRYLALNGGITLVVIAALATWAAIGAGATNFARASIAGSLVLTVGPTWTVLRWRRRLPAELRPGVADVFRWPVLLAMTVNLVLFSSTLLVVGMRGKFSGPIVGVEWMVAVALWVLFVSTVVLAFVVGQRPLRGFADEWPRVLQGTPPSSTPHDGEGPESRPPAPRA